MDRLLLLGNIGSKEIWAFFDTTEELVKYVFDNKVNVVYILKNHIEVEITYDLKQVAIND